MNLNCFFKFKRYTLNCVHHKSSGPLRLVFVHGLCADSEVWKNQYDFFKDQFEIIIPDLLGHGKSSRIPPCSVIPMNTKIISELVKSLPKKDTIFIGHSLGGIIINDIMGIISDSSFVFVDSPCIRTKEIREEYKSLANIIRKNDNPTKFIKNEWFGNFFPSSSSKKLKDSIINKLDNFDIEWISKFVESTEVSAKCNQACSIFIVEGNQFFPKQCESSWLNYYPNAIQWRFEGEGHYYFLEKPNLFNNSLKKFISGSFIDDL